MDIILRTNDPEKCLGFYAVNRFSDNSGYCSELRVLSHGFAAAIQFCFEPPRLLEFIERLDRMNQSLTGEARLKPAYESNYINLAVERTGAVLVSGEVRSLLDGVDHLIRFGFRTDQTCLAPLVTDLRACSAMAAT